jgi:hypothetical protein
VRTLRGSDPCAGASIPELDVRLPRRVAPISGLWRLAARPAAERIRVEALGKAAEPPSMIRPPAARSSPGIGPRGDAS